MQSIILMMELHRKSFDRAVIPQKEETDLLLNHIYCYMGDNSTYSSSTFQNGMEINPSDPIRPVLVAKCFISSYMRAY